MKSIFFVLLFSCIVPVTAQIQINCVSVNDLLYPYSNATTIKGIDEYVLSTLITTNLMTYNNSRFFLSSSQRYNEFNHVHRKGMLLNLAPCEHFVINFKESSLSFRGYKLVEYSIPNMKIGCFRNFDNDTCVTKYHMPISSVGRIDGFLSNDFREVDSSILRLMQKGLILDLSGPIFISGYMFLDEIADEFFDVDITTEFSDDPLSHVNKTSFEQFIKIRYFNYDPESISINIQNYSATFYSPVTNKNHTCTLKTKPVTTSTGDKKLSIIEDFQ
ncbi:MAG: hypothetical protein IPM69_07230 [Ignavibacteria bacterium]|nr:hypothetical protein [Ignavibacteria bacterium]